MDQVTEQQAAYERIPGEPEGEGLAELATLVTRTGGFQRERMAVQAPFTGRVIGYLPKCQPEDVDQALTLARRAQRLWQSYDVWHRAEIILRFHDRILDWQDRLLDLMQMETGKARIHAFDEVMDVANVARHYAYRAERYLRPTRKKGAVPALTATWLLHHPVGIVGLIAPWNYPLSMSISDALPALLAGNAVILKPSEQTSFTALLALQMLHEAGLPEGVFQILTGEGPELSPPLIEQVDYIGFTGSTRVGRIVARQAGERLIKSSMELGGKNPMLVFDDADLERAIQGAVHACFTNAGQLCISAERLYVQSGIYRRFRELLVRRAAAIRMGASFEYDMELGSLTTRAQLDKVQEHVEDAVRKGARVLVGGKARPDLGPLFFEPTILEGVTPEMRVARAETFGPVVSLYRFERMDDAIRMANDSQYGLNASVWTRDTLKGRNVASQIQCGTVNINDAWAATWGSVDAPMGGMKASGIGRRHGDEGFLRYTEPQTIALQRLGSVAPPPGLPARTFVRLMTVGLKAIRRMPGLR